MRSIPTLLSLLLVVACGEPEPIALDPSDDTNPTDPTGPTGPTNPTGPTDPTNTACVPTREAFEENALPAIERSCGTCHGETVAFGAPYTLLDYNELVAGEAPNRKVDAFVAELMDRTMPPATQGLMPHNDLDTMVSWGSCGELHPDPSDGLEASQPIWEAPTDPPAGVSNVDLRVDNEAIGPNDIDDYRYFLFSNLVDDDMFIRRMEALIDDERVVHHITLRELLGLNYLYTWAPGTGPIEFPDGGLRLKRFDTLLMEIHYNNGAGLPNVVDSSGLRLWVDEPSGTEWGMASPSVYDISVPPNSIGEATSVCSPTREFDILAGMPHMHETGTDFLHTITRSDGTEETLIELSGWSFEAQYFYEMPTTVYPGDQLTLTCTYDNPYDHTLTWGEGTSDEMCFNFIYVTPPEAAFQCLF